jgi:uncharacterized protein YjbJ (UPF0337 family)
MSDILEGRWRKLRGRAKKAWGALVGDEDLEAEGHVDVAAGAVQESYGTAKKRATRELTKGIDRLASRAKRFVAALKS